MTVVLLVEDARPRDVLIGVSPLAELAACLHALTEAEHHAAVRPWRIEVRQSLTDPLASQLRRYSPLWAAYRTRALYPTRPELGHDLDTELANLQTMPLADFARLTGFACGGGYTGMQLDRLLTDPHQATALLATARARSTARLELAEALVADPARFRDELVGFLQACRGAFFDRTWGQVEAKIGQFATTIQRRLRREPLAEVLGSLSATAECLSHPARVVLDKFHHSVVNIAREGLLLIPSWYCWPHLTVKHEPGFPPVIQFAYSPQRGLRPTQIRQRLDALSEPSRMRLCRLIAREPLSTLALAERVGMTEPQVSRHLRRLREAGLVRSERDGRFVYYTLDVEEVARLGSDVLTALLH